MGEAANLDEWTVKANDVMDIALFTKSEKNQKDIQPIFNFRPTWTYPIVGDNETISGYKGLKISLRYNASDMRPHLSYTSTNRVSSGNHKHEMPDIQNMFKPFLPLSAFGSKLDFVKAVQNTPDDWQPPGELIEKYEGEGGCSYEVWKGSLADPLVLGLVNRIQILVSLLIEGGTPIATEPSEEREMDPLARWTVFFLYQKRPQVEHPGKFTYVFAGYSTVYRFFIFRPTALGQSASNPALELPKEDVPFTEFPCRSRISQFIIIEPFQHKGNGQRLYNTIYKALLEDPNTFEITVEDPNEAFDDLRDIADLKYLRQHPEFGDIKINTGIMIPSEGPVPSNILDKKALETLRNRFKIAPRQFSRLIEMHLMSKLPESVRTDIKAEVEGKGKKAATKAEQYEHRLWQLITKSRINAQNKEQLATLEPAERVKALKDAVSSVELEYSLLLSMIEQRGVNETSKSKKRSVGEDDEEVEENLENKKRKLQTVVDDADEDAEDRQSEEFVEDIPKAASVDLLSD